MNQRNDRIWSAKWIGGGFTHGNSTAPSKPAPFFRKIFQYDGEAKNAEVFFCGLGWSELYLNGKKVGDHVLEPVVTLYDRRSRYIRYDVSSLLRKGENVFGAILGNGWYDCSTTDAWHFDNAPWLDYPKLIFELVLDGATVLTSDESWKCWKEDGPIRFNELRNGEFYDARKECPGWADSGFDDSRWTNAAVTPGPGGILTAQTMPPCKVMKHIASIRSYSTLSGGKIYDIGQNITGWSRIKVRGAAGAEIKLCHSELISTFNDQVNQKNINLFIKSGETQTDCYTLKGEGIEEWEPRFTYHGFRYVEVTIAGDAEVLELEGCLVHTSFERIGSLESSDPMLNRLFECTRWSYIDNFTGIPTDCPHREKNGWTGDALIAAETGLFLYDTASSYHDWLQTVGDAQRPNGQLPGIVPTGGWGFNWGSGPAWDSAFLLIPWYVYVYTGRKQIIEEHYEGMKQYIEYLGTLATDHIVSFGLGDWCHVDRTRITDVRVTSTGYYYADTLVMMKCAELLGHTGDADRFRRLAAEIKESFHRAFYRGDGIYAGGEMTALGCALYQGLCPEEETAVTAAKLDHLVRANRYRVDFGILGAKYIPRVLADHGYGESAYRILTQPAFPGWMDWINRGATTLWETWDGEWSRNHIMYGDIAAWMMQYLGGIRPDERHPGFSELMIHPFVPQELDSMNISYRIPKGDVKVRWTRNGNHFALEVSIPEQVPCRVRLPDGSIHTQNVMCGRYECSLR